VLVLSCLLLSSALAADPLPVHRIRFYETGVAWFERRGVTDTTAATLPIPTSHLDDALKSLVVLDGDGLDAVTFASAQSPDAARVGAGLPEHQALDFAATVRALIGEDVVVDTDGGSLVGQLLDVEGPLSRAADPDGDGRPLPDAYALVLLGDDGSVQRHVTEGQRAVRPVDAAVAARLAQAASTGTAGRAARPKGLGLQLHRRGELALGYVAEAPVWRVAYRLHEGDDGDARLSAWALVHNPTDEDWTRVRVELANGEPDSFLYPLAAPRYADRELRVPDRALATVAQLAQQTVDDMWQVDRSGGLSVGMGGIGASGYGVGAGGSYGSASGVGTVSAAPRRGKAPPPIETPSQFVYVVQRPVDLPARHSALVPMLRDRVHAETVVAFPSAGGGARTAVWLVNDTERTLPAGVVTVVRQGGLEGEAQLQRLKPTETQLVTVGRELDVTLSRSSEALPERPDALRIVDGLVHLEHVQGTTHRFELHNRSGRARAVWVGVSTTGTVEGAGRTELDRHTGDTWVALQVPQGTHDEQVAVTTRRVHTHDPTTVSSEQWAAWRQAGLGDDEQLKTAEQLAAQREDLDQQRVDLDAQIGRVQAQLDGLRRSLAAAESEAAPLTRQASQAERELRRLTERLAERDRQRQQVLQQLRDHLDGDGVGQL
jgi:hypothetical protein